MVYASGVPYCNSCQSSWERMFRPRSAHRRRRSQDAIWEGLFLWDEMKAWLPNLSFLSMALWIQTIHMAILWVHVYVHVYTCTHGSVLMCTRVPVRTRVLLVYYSSTYTCTYNMAIQCIAIPPVIPVRTLEHITYILPKCSNRTILYFNPFYNGLSVGQTQRVVTTFRPGIAILQYACGHIAIPVPV